MQSTQGPTTPKRKRLRPAAVIIMLTTTLVLSAAFRFPSPVYDPANFKEILMATTLLFLLIGLLFTAAFIPRAIKHNPKDTAPQNPNPHGQEKPKPDSPTSQVNPSTQATTALKTPTWRPTRRPHF